ncbi:unnamed protein product, partial [Coregonus sp. 'balchen']
MGIWTDARKRRTFGEISRSSIWNLWLRIKKKQGKKITNDLKELRNKVTFIYFICNAMRLVATFTLQVIGNAVTIRIPKYNINLTQTS